MIGRSPFPAQSDSRIRVWTLIVSVGFLGLALRLFQLQVIRGPEMYRLAEQNRTQVIPLLAPRGRLLDRAGELILDNAPHFSLFFSKPTSALAPERDVDKELVRLFPDQHVQIMKKMAEARRTGKMTRVLAGLPRQKALALIERRLTLPGVTVLVEPRRHARHGDLASHLLGYVAEISPAELDRRKAEGYRMGQLIGKMGVERQYDAYLRGQDGGLQFEMDASGRHVNTMRRIVSQPGSDMVLTLDRRLQEAAEKGLKISPSGRGAAVALDPRTGAVLALASQPGFDPSSDPADYLGDPSLPFFNRALQGTYPPGSVFKVVTALSGLEDAKWSVQKAYFCPGVFHLGSKEFGCWSKHNRQDFMGAVAWSCNVYFFNMGLIAGPDSIEHMARAFGLGEKTGIDLWPESSGLIPGRQWKQSAQKVGWYDGDTVNFSIGQGAVSVTPLQAAVMMAAVANGGDVWRPYVVDRVLSAEGEAVYEQKPRLRRRLPLSSRSWEVIHRAMEGVVTTGSGRGVHRSDLVIGGKTGTAQNPHGKDHAWFAAYAGLPGQPPSLVVVVFVEHGGRGSVAAGPVAREIINAAFPRS